MLINKLQQRLRRKSRVRAKVRGTKTMPRISVYKSNMALYAQVIDDDAQKTLASVSTMKDKKINAELAKKAATTLAKSLKDAKITSCVFDRNGYKYHGIIQSFADELRASGLKF